MLEQLEVLQNKQEFECLVGKYEIGHSTLSLVVRNRVSRTRQNFFIVFENVKYFSGPFRWQGVNFKLATREECLERLLQANIYSEDTKLGDETPMKLYQVDLGAMVVEIIASYARVDYDVN